MLLNKTRALELMDQYGLDVIVASSPVNVSYFTGLDCWLYRSFREYMLCPGGPDQALEAYAIFPREADPTLILDLGTALYAEHLAVTKTKAYGNSDLAFPEPKDDLTPTEEWIRALHHSPERNNTAAEILIATLKEDGIKRNRIGIESRWIRDQTRKQLETAFPLTAFLDCTELIRLIRMIKTEEEIARLDKSAEINELAGYACLAAARPGMAVGELCRTYSVECAKLDGVFEHFIYSARGLGITSCPDYRLEKGDALYVDFGCIHRMYYADTGTTLIMASPSDQHSGIYHCLRDAVEQASLALKPGVNSRDPLNVMRTHLAQNGLERCNAHIHGIGLEPRDYPIPATGPTKRISDDLVTFDSDITLQENMVINLEAPYYCAGFGGFHVERTFVMTPNGRREMTRHDRNQPIIAQ